MWPDIQKTVIGILQDENLANRVEVLEDSREDCTTRWRKSQDYVGIELQITKSKFKFERVLYPMNKKSLNINRKKNNKNIGIHVYIKITMNYRPFCHELKVNIYSKS